MRAYYGLAAGLAIVLAGQAMAETRPAYASKIAQAALLPKVRGAAVEESSLATVRTAQVRQASVTYVAQTAMPGLADTTKRVEDYFNGLTTLQADFTQSVTGEPAPSKGTFYLRKPRQFLWQYETPVKQRIISTGAGVYYIDQERNQVTQLPVNAGVARLFNSKTLNFSQQGLRAASARSTSRELMVTFTVDKKIAMSDQSGLASLTLVFDRLGGDRLRLTRIDALDTLSVTTRVDFANVRENIGLPAKLFAFTPGVYDQRN